MVDQTLASDKNYHGKFEALMAELRLENPEEFKNFVRVDVQMFQELLHAVLSKVKESLEKELDQDIQSIQD